MRTRLAIILLVLLLPALVFGVAPTETYVDPSLDSLSGAGSVGDPYGDLQYALDTMTRDATNGDRVNVKAGTAEVTTGTLTIATYGVPTDVAPLIIRGYASAAGDGGIGQIDGDGSYGCFAGSEDYVHIQDMEVFNGGSAVLVNLDNSCSIIDVTIHNSTGNLLHADIRTQVIRCYFYDGSANGALVDGGLVRDCYFANGTKDFTNALRIFSSSSASRNIFNLDGASNGIWATGVGLEVTNNSILSASGTGAGIILNANDQSTVLNNIVEGFIGVGGNAIDFNSNTINNAVFAGQAYYNNTNSEANKVAGEWLIDADNEDPLASSGFAKSGANTFANRFVYYAPLDVGSVWAGGWPNGANVDKGAVQHVAAGGTTVIVIDD